MKRIFSVVFLLIVVMLAVVPVMAAEGESVVSPRYSYIGRIYSDLSIGTLGFSACHADCHAEAGDYVVLVAKLQQRDGSNWVTLKTWTATDDNAASISKNYTVAKGYTYRLSASCSVYSASGVLLESGICNSHQVVY